MSTALLRSKIRYLLGIFFIVIVIGITFFTFTARTFYLLPSSSLAESHTTPQSNTKEPERTSSPFLSIAGTVIPVELATTTEAVQKGLSGRSSLDPQRGMLFMFKAPARYRFWMRDMHFPIDIIWINKGVVVSITKSATTTFNPATPKFYSSETPAQYALEVNAGFSATHNITKGSKVEFRNIPSLR